MSSPTKEEQLQTKQKISGRDSETETPPSESSPSDSDEDSSDEDDDYEPNSHVRPDGTTKELDPKYSDSENTIRRSLRSLYSESLRSLEEEEKYIKFEEDLFDFPKDPENWREEDLREYWADAPFTLKKPGWDPHNVDKKELKIIRKLIRAGRDPPIAPFYVPYRKPYPVIPNNHPDISTPKSVIEELDRIEEFLTWRSFIFKDRSSYEGTVWDDLAHGKGVYVAEGGLVRYEGEWLRNNMEGHGVIEVDIPTIQPVPGSKLEAKLRAKGHIITRDFLPPGDRKWLEMDIEDNLCLAELDGLLRKPTYEIPFYENNEWVRQFGRTP